MTSDTALQCAICDEAIDDPRLMTECMSCSRSFHLNPYNDGDHKDCGDALIGPTQGVEFWCHQCLEQLNAEMAANPPDPRGMIDNLAVPAELLSQVRGNRGTPVTPPAIDTPRPGAPPARRGRPSAPKRYRRVDR